jgi:DNA-binding phage protein
MATSRDYHPYLIESLKDPSEAAAFLDAVLEDGTLEEIQLALTNITEAQLSGLNDAQIAAHRQALHTTLTQQNHLDLPILLNILGELGFRISVTHKDVA